MSINFDHPNDKIASSSGGPIAISGQVAAITDGDTLTWHEANQQSVTATSYATIFDLAAATDLVCGALIGHGVGFRLTVDGTVVANRTVAVNGENSGATIIGSVSLPAAKATSSMKLEAYNTQASSKLLGWRVATR